MLGVSIILSTACININLEVEDLRRVSRISLVGITRQDFHLPFSPFTNFAFFTREKKQTNQKNRKKDTNFRYGFHMNQNVYFFQHLST